MSDPSLRVLATLFASAVFAPECFAQNAPTPASEAALAEIRKGLKTCEALSEWNRDKRRCLKECSNAEKAIPVTNPDWTPQYVAGCNQRVKAAQATEERDAVAEAQKAEQRNVAQARARETALAEARKGVETCQALPESNGGRKGCLAACGKAVESLPTTEAERVPRWASSCSSSVRMANYYKESAERAVVINAEREKKNAESRAAYQETEAERVAAKQAAEAKATAAAQAAAAKAASAPKPATAAAANTSTPASAGKIGLRTEGAIDWGEFENELTFYKVFNGEFGTYHKGSLGVRALMTYYLDWFQHDCSDFLPPDAVTMVRKTFLVSENSLGMEERELIGTDEITMAPRFVYGYENYSAGAGIGSFVDVQRPNRMIKDAIDFLKTWQKDSRLLFSVEACQGPAMLQLGENIARVTSGRPPIQSEPNAAQILANLRVRVPQNVEDADVRAKRAKADAWWSAQRATWGKSPQVQATDDQYGRGNWIRVKYEAIAPDFQVPIPGKRPDQIVQIDIEKSYNRRIRSIQVGFETLSPYDVSQFGPVNSETYRKDTQAAYQEGARILKCTYDAGGTLNIVEYWFQKNPQSIDLEASRATWNKHPLLKVRSARNDCPVVMP